MEKLFEQDFTESSVKNYKINFPQYIEQYEDLKESYRRTIQEDCFLKGRYEGIIEGKKEGRIESAENCLLLGITIVIASKISGLTIKEVTKIARRLGLS